MRLRDVGCPEFTWGDLLDVVQHLPKTSAVYRAVHGDEDAEWGLLEHLAASTADSLAWLVWSKTEDATKKRNRPKPIPRPGVVDESKKQIGAGSLPIDEMKAWLGGDFANMN